jgi:hypothetical protein
MNELHHYYTQTVDTNCFTNGQHVYRAIIPARSDAEPKMKKMKKYPPQKWKINITRRGSNA